MSEHAAEVLWSRNGAKFKDLRYSRRHAWRFDGGVVVPASASPHVVPEPLADPSAVDPEEAFVASLSSCHMLWFLSIAAGRGFVVERYRDRATGTLGRDARGRVAITSVSLEPETTFAGEPVPSEAELAAMHDEAHEKCFLASSVTADVRCRPRFG